MSDPGLVVVGASQAAVQLASTLRERGYRAPITLLSAESHQPYQRPALSKALLNGTATPQSLQFRAPAFYEDNDIALVLGRRCTDIDFAADRSGTLRCDGGLRIPFSRLALCTGARPRPLVIPGADSDGVVYLRDLTDALMLQARLARATDVAVIGGGFIGLEVAATARGLGKNVAIIEAGPRLMGRAVGAATADFFRDAHSSMATTVRLSCGVARIYNDDRGQTSGVELQDGTVFRAQVVVVGVGAEPRDDLARAAGLHCDNGIVVDQYSLTSDGHTIAIGDCANLPNPAPHRGDDSRLRLESVDNAIEQAKTAAATVLGERIPYESTPWFWSDQGSNKLQIVGLSQDHDVAVVRRYPDAKKQSTIYYRNGQMIAAETINAPADFMTLRRALNASITFGTESAADPSIAFKSLLAAAL